MTADVATERTLAEQLAAFAARTQVDGAPEEVRESVRQRVLDVLGLAAAARPLETSEAALGFVRDQGGPPQAHVVGLTEPVSASWAAFGNGVLAHSLDYDDTHLPSVLHPSASVVPAALAAAEAAGADGRRLVDAAAVGIETAVRLGMVGYDRTSNNSVFFEHGQHATSICGAIGSAVAAGAVWGLDETGLRDVIGVAASMSSGIIEANRTGGTVKRLHCGWAAHAGVTAALLVARGLTGPPTALEGRFGFFRAFLHDTGNLAELTEGLGTHWEVPSIFFKPYPANHFTHTGLDAARRLREQGLRPDDVSTAQLAVPPAVVRTIGEPLDVKQRPETGYQAQFSGPYMVVLGLVGGTGLGAGLDDFSDAAVGDPQRRALMSQVDVVGDPECEAIYPYQFPSILRVTTTSGERLEAKVLVNRGGPDDPLSADELAVKYHDNAARLVDRATADQLERVVRTLGPDTDMSDAMTLLAVDPDVQHTDDG